MLPANRVPVALTIAGSDSSGGAGIQADLKTFTALGVYGASVITALTAQNTLGVQGISVVDAAFVVAQLDSVLGDLDVRVAKTGMLATAPIARAVVERLRAAPQIAVVVDPVMIATSGDVLLADEAIAVYRSEILPRAALVTPNIPEAARLLAEPAALSVADCARQARALVAMGARAALVKGGHGAGPEVADVLCVGDVVTVFRHPRIATSNTHGTGCTLSAAIVAFMVRGSGLEAAVGDAIGFLSTALESGAGQSVGAGSGPVDHLHGLHRNLGPVVAR